MFLLVVLFVVVFELGLLLVLAEFELGLLLVLAEFEHFAEYLRCWR